MAEAALLTMINSLPSLLEKLGKALQDLESHEDASIDKGLFKEIEGHFWELEASVVNKCLELEIREKAFKEQESDALMLIASQEADIAGREQNLWDRLQELKDGAVSAIAEARANHQLASLEPMDIEDSKDVELTERFPLAPLLKGYLRDLRRNSQGKRGNSGNAENANAQELVAVKEVVQCIRDYMLQAEYPLDPLLRRIAQLEKALSNDKARSNDKKRFSGSTKKQQFKKPRPTGGTYGSIYANIHSRQAHPVPVVRETATDPSRSVPSVFVERATYAGLSDKHPHLSTSYDYQPPSQSTLTDKFPHLSTYDYQAPAQANPHHVTSYDYQLPSQSTYAQQAYDQRSYYYPADGDPTARSYTAAPPSSYGNYAGSGMPATQPPYM